MSSAPLDMTRADAEAARPTETDLLAQLRQLRRENAALRREVHRLTIYKSMAYRDHLTGLHNRRYLDERLREEFARHARDAGHAFSLIAVDVDDFKRINDELGHAIGDEALIAVARFLTDNVREVDICCRTGGDEFALLLPSTDYPGAETVVSRLVHGLDSLSMDLPTPVRLSFGIAASSCAGATSPQHLLEIADEAMYRHKRRTKQLREAG